MCFCGSFGVLFFTDNTWNELQKSHDAALKKIKEEKIMATKQEIRNIERQIVSDVGDVAVEAYELGCTGVHIGFSEHGTPWAECYMPPCNGKVEERASLTELLRRASFAVIEAKEGLVRIDEVLTPEESAALSTLYDEFMVLDKVLDGHSDCSCMADCSEGYEEVVAEVVDR